MELTVNKEDEDRHSQKHFLAVMFFAYGNSQTYECNLSTLTKKALFQLGLE